MITVKTYTSNEVLEMKERKYQQFLNYYMNTNLLISEIFDIIGLSNKRNSTAKYIRNKLRKEGYNSFKRANSIRKGEWA